MKNVEGWIFILALAGPLFSGFLLSILFSKVKIDEEGIRFRMYYVSFNKISRIKLRWGGRLMTYGKRLDLGYILLNPEKFVEAVKAVKPEALVGYRGKRESRKIEFTLLLF